MIKISETEEKASLQEDTSSLTLVQTNQHVVMPRCADSLISVVPCDNLQSLNLEFLLFFLIKN